MADPGLPARLPLLIESAAEKKDNNLMEMSVAVVIVSHGHSVGLLDLTRVFLHGVIPLDLPALYIASQLGFELRSPLFPSLLHSFAIMLPSWGSWMPLTTSPINYVPNNSPTNQEAISFALECI